jgi:hypothetical protein
MIYTHKITGTQTFDFDNISQNLTIKNFQFGIHSVNYDWSQNKCNIIVMFRDELGNIFSRTFTFDCNDNWNADKCIEELLNLEEFEEAEEL